MKGRSDQVETPLFFGAPANERLVPVATIRIAEEEGQNGGAFLPYGL